MLNRWNFLKTGFYEGINDYIHESRTGRNVQHPLLPLLRQSVYSRLAGYEDTNDAERLAQDPAMRVIVYHSMHSGHPGAAQMTFENIRHLMKSDGGPLTALATLCRQAGMEFFPRVRMNSHYPIDPSSPSYGRFRTENPELLIGRPGETIPEGTVESGIRTGLNYALPRVREYMYSLITELFERFDVDGVELDFMRHPASFRTEEAFQKRLPDDRPCSECAREDDRGRLIAGQDDTARRTGAPDSGRLEKGGRGCRRVDCRGAGGCRRGRRRVHSV